MVMCMMCIDDVREAEHQMKMNDIHLKTKRPANILILNGIISFYQKCSKARCISWQSKSRQAGGGVGGRYNMVWGGAAGLGSSSDGWP